MIRVSRVSHINTSVFVILQLLPGYVNINIYNILIIFVLDNYIIRAATVRERFLPGDLRHGDSNPSNLAKASRTTAPQNPSLRKGGQGGSLPIPYHPHIIANSDRRVFQAAVRKGAGRFACQIAPIRGDDMRPGRCSILTPSPGASRASRTL